MEEYSFEKLNEIWQRIHNLMMIRESNKDGLSYDEELEYLEKYLEFFKWEDEQDFYRNINKVETKEVEINYLIERIDILKRNKAFNEKSISELLSLFKKYPLSYSKHSMWQDFSILNLLSIQPPEFMTNSYFYRPTIFNFHDAYLNISKITMDNESFKSLLDDYCDEIGVFNGRKRKL